MGKNGRIIMEKKDSISLKLGSSKNIREQDSISLKLGDERNSISLKVKNTASQLSSPRNRLVVEMTSAALIEEKEAIKIGKSVWPSDIDMSSSGRLRNIEADPETITRIEEWAESKGMNCL